MCTNLHVTTFVTLKGESLCIYTSSFHKVSTTGITENKHGNKRQQ